MRLHKQVHRQTRPLFEVPSVGQKGRREEHDFEGKGSRARKRNTSSRPSTLLKAGAPRKDGAGSDRTGFRYLKVDDKTNKSNMYLVVVIAVTERSLGDSTVTIHT